jgi:hypothetical protein
MTFLESIGLGQPTMIPTSTTEIDEIVKLQEKKQFVPHQKREKQGTTEYKNGSMYLYCTPEDKRLAKLLAIEHGISMKELVHRMLAVSSVNKAKIFADPDAGVQPLVPENEEPPIIKFTVMKAGEFMEKYFDEPIRRYRAMADDKGDKK